MKTDRRMGLKTLLIIALLFILTGCFTRSYLVSFESNGGTNIKGVLVPVGELLEKPDDPVKEGYVFAGWFMDMDLTQRFDFDKPVEKDMTLYAKWNPARYTITWDSMGGSEIEPSEVSYKGAISAPQDPVREGYVFAGWYYEPEYQNLFDFRTLMPARNFTLYARWTLGEFKVSFETYGGSVIEDVEGKYGEEFTVDEPNRHGYTFGGWFLDEDFAEEFTEFKIPSRDTVLYAKWVPVDINVTFVIEPGRNYTATVKYNQRLTEPERPVKTGHTFMGWYLGDKAFDFSTPITDTNGITLEAKWERIKYTVSFDSKGGSEVAPVEVGYEMTFAKPADPIKTGHRFLGWYKDEDFQTPWDFENDQVTGDITLYANWEANTYRINFVTYGSPISPIEQKYGTPIFAPAAPTREGYTFAGWYRDSNYTNPFTFPETMPAENITLYAYWTANKYLVKYYVDGALYKEVSVEFGAEFPEVPAPEKTGYTFAGWSGLPEIMPANDVIVTANFTVNSYKLTYYVDGAVYRMFTVAYGTDIVPLEGPSKTGYTFQGWSDIPEKMPAEDVNVYGTFQVNNYNLSVTADPVRGTVTVEPNQTSVAYGTQVTVTATPNPGYKFSYWDKDGEHASGQAAYSFSMPADNVNLTAVFVPEDDVEYKVNYYVEGLDGEFLLRETITLQGTTGVVVTAPSRNFPGFTYDADNELNFISAPVAGDGSLVLSVYYSRNTYTLTYKVDGTTYLSRTYKFEERIEEVADPEKTGYTFTGWTGLPEIMPANDLTVTADFSLNTYTITYVLNGGSLTGRPESYTVESELSINNPTRNGYKFLGWTYEGQSVPVVNLKINRGTTGDLTLTANWQANTYNITYFDGANRLILEPSTYTIATGAVLPTPSKTGYNFEGWYTNAEFYGDPVESIPQGVTGDEIYYAKFVPITYSITYWNGLELVVDPNLIYEYTYSETEDVILRNLPEITGHTFTWVNANNETVTRIPAGMTGNLELYANYSVRYYDVSFYLDNGDLLGTIKNVAYGSEISLAMVFEGKQEFVDALIELIVNIAKLNQGVMTVEQFDLFLKENYVLLKDISPTIASCLQAVDVQQSPEAIGALLVAAKTELFTLSQPLDVKIKLFERLRNKIEEFVQDSDNPLAQLEFGVYLFATQEVYSAYLSELAEEIAVFLNQEATPEEKMNALQNLNSYASFELNRLGQYRQSFRKNYPTREGYVFIGWKLGADTLYLTHGEGYVFEGKITMAPASAVPGQAAKLIAAYTRLSALEASFASSTNLLSWNYLSPELLAELHDGETEEVEVHYEIWVQQGESHYLYASTQNNKVELDNPGTYVVKVIPVVYIYDVSGEGRILINKVTAPVTESQGMEVTVKKLENSAVLDKSGNYYHRMLEGGEYVYYFFSNTEITFPGSQFTILTGNGYVSVKNGNTLVIGSEYTTGEKIVEFTFTASAGGTVYKARIYPYISQFELGESLTDYLNTVGNIENTLYYNKDVEPYYVGKALFGTEADVLQNGNAFRFDLLIKTTGGKKIELAPNQFIYKAYEIAGGSKVEVPISNNTSGDWQIYRDGNNFYFRYSGKTYEIVIEIRDEYVPKVLKPDPEDPEKPALINPKSFTITTNDGVNVFTNEELQIAYADTRVKAINIHRNIEAQLRPEQTYTVDGVTYPYNYASEDIVSSFYSNNLHGKVGNVYQRISPADSENPDNLVVNGNYFTIDGSKLPYTNYEPGSIGIELPGGSVPIQPGALNTIPGYKIRNVQIAIFNHIALTTVNPAKVNYGGVTYKNLTVIGNTRTPNVNYSEGTDKIQEALEVMGRNSGGYVAIANSFNLRLEVDNVVVGSSTIAIWSKAETDVIVNNAYLYNNWANTVYGYGPSSVYIANSVLEESGGAAIHIEDTKFSSDYAQTVTIDTATVEVNNWVSGEEAWFKAYSMELAAMRMKAQINSGVRTTGASILRNITDPSSGLVSRKMNFVMLILPVDEQLSPSEKVKTDTPAEKYTEIGYTDMTLYMLQSQSFGYNYGAPDGDKFVIQLNEPFFQLFATMTGQQYNATAIPFGEKVDVTLPSGVSDIGTAISTNFLAVQADLSTVSRGHGIVVLGMDNPR